VSLQERINSVIQILPTDCRIKRGKKTYEREKMLVMVMEQYNRGAEDIKVEFGVYKLSVKREQVC